MPVFVAYMTQTDIEADFKRILEELQAYKQKDCSFIKGHILGSMCTAPHQIAKKAYDMFLDSNLGDPRLFSGSKKIEQNYLDFIGKMLHGPQGHSGQVVSGGTEGNITAIWLARRRSEGNNIIVPASAHFSFQKIASLMGLKIKSIPLTQDYVMDIEVLKENINKKTVAVVGIAGSTELGAVDPIEEISQLCIDNEVFCHVDAAFGGFVLPFLKELNYPIPQWDFQLPGVSSISVDAHKVGYAAIPLGLLMVRESKWWSNVGVKALCIDEKIQTSLLGTRSAGPVAAGYAVARLLGFEGYKKVIEGCMQTTFHLKRRIEQIGLELVMKPTMNVAGIKVKDVDATVDALAKQGWFVNRISHLSCIRLVMMPHVTIEVIDEFVDVLEKCVGGEKGR